VALSDRSPLGVARRKLRKLSMFDHIKAHNGCAPVLDAALQANIRMLTAMQDDLVWDSRPGFRNICRFGCLRIAVLIVLGDTRTDTMYSPPRRYSERGGGDKTMKFWRSSTHFLGMPPPRMLDAVAGVMTFAPGHSPASEAGGHPCNHVVVASVERLAEEMKDAEETLRVFFPYTPPADRMVLVVTADMAAGTAVQLQLNPAEVVALSAPVHNARASMRGRCAAELRTDRDALELRQRFEFSSGLGYRAQEPGASLLAVVPGRELLQPVQTIGSRAHIFEKVLVGTGEVTNVVPAQEGRCTMRHLRLPNTTRMLNAQQMDPDKECALEVTIASLIAEAMDRDERLKPAHNAAGALHHFYARLWNEAGRSKCGPWKQADLVAT
jgi:hypothetical protein